MVKVYGLGLSFPVNRVRMCLNAIGVDHEFVIINPLAGETQTEEYLKMNPSGKVPAIDDDGFYLFEGNAIMKYLCRKHNSDLYPTDIVEQAHVDKWLDFIVAHLNNGLAKVFFNKIVAGLVGVESDEKSMQEGYGFLERFMTVIEKQLGITPYLAGDNMTIADIALLATIDPFEVIDIKISDYPNVAKWASKLTSQPFYTKVHGSYKETLDAAMAG
jgi:glutathione S-transferase